MAPKKDKDTTPIQVTGTERQGDKYIVHFDAADDVEIPVADAQARATELGHDSVEWPLLGDMAKEKLGR